MEQYRKGEAFVAAIERAGRCGRAAPAVGRAGDAADARGDRGARRLGPADGARTDRRRHGVTDDSPAGPGPGSGPGGVPVAIALTPILSARYRNRDLEAIRAAAPGARDRHDRLRRSPRRAAGRRGGDAPRPPPGGDVRPDPVPRAVAALGPFRHGGRRARADAGEPLARPRDHERAGRLQPADRRVRDAHDPRGLASPAAAHGAPGGADVAAAGGARAAGRDRGHRGPGVHRARRRRAGDGVRLPGRRHAAPPGGRLPRHRRRRRRAVPRLAHAGPRPAAGAPAGAPRPSRTSWCWRRR